MRRLEWLSVYDQYLAEFCDEKGVQEDNLTPEEASGLKSLKKRVADGTLVISQTDKSGRFAIMSQEEYLEAGMKHVAKDEEVGLEFMMKNQKRLNGHMSMILKTFNVGAAWNHQAIIRATKLTHSLSVAPLYLLYKDHKGWTVETGGVPPTRPVASAGGGQDDHLSETVSQILEPVANSAAGGMETASTQDFTSKIVELNKGNLELEDVDLESVDKMFKEEEDRADMEYDRIDREEFMEEKPVVDDDKLATSEVEQQPKSGYGVGNMSKGQAKVHFQVEKNNKMVTLNHQKQNKIENVHLDPQKINILETQPIKNNTLNIVEELSFPMPSPDDYMIEEMVEIEEEDEQERNMFCVTGVSGQGKVGILEKIAMLEDKWMGTSYMMVADACKIMLDWDPVRGAENRDTLLEWMLLHNTTRLVEEAGHMISSWDTQWKDEDLDNVAEQMLVDSVEILTVLVVAWNIKRGALQSNIMVDIENENHET